MNCGRCNSNMGKEYRRVTSKATFPFQLIRGFGMFTTTMVHSINVCIDCLSDTVIAVMGTHTDKNIEIDVIIEE